MYLLSALHGHGHVLLALGQRHPDRVHAGDELAVLAEHLERAACPSGS